MIDEGTLKRNLPGIPWDQPVRITIPGFEHRELWACRYCIALHGLKAKEILSERVPEFVYYSRADALAHVDNVHHG